MDNKNNAAPLQMETLDERELAQVRHAEHYAEHFSAAGIPGHSQLLLIAKLARMVEALRTAPPSGERVIKLMWDQGSNCYRDIMTGVKVDVR